MIRLPHPRTFRSPAGFTLMELILVMLLLATMMALGAPHLSRFFRGRTAIEEGRRVAALTRFARAEAISQGQIMEVWFNNELRQYGMRCESPYYVTDNSEITYDLTQNVSFRLPQLDRRTQIEAIIRFQPDGLIDPESALEVVLVEDQKDLFVLQLATDRLRYELRGPEDATI